MQLRHTTANRSHPLAVTPAMATPASRMIPLLVALTLAVLLHSSAGQGANCPRWPLVNASSSGGKLVFAGLPPFHVNVDPTYHPGGLGPWYRLATGIVNVVRPGGLPYGEPATAKHLVVCACTVDKPLSTAPSPGALKGPIFATETSPPGTVDTAQVRRTCCSSVL